MKDLPCAEEASKMKRSIEALAESWGDDDDLGAADEASNVEMAQEMINELDSDGNGIIDFWDF